MQGHGVGRAGPSEADGRRALPQLLLACWRSWGSLSSLFPKPVKVVLPPCPRMQLWPWECILLGWETNPEGGCGASEATETAGYKGGSPPPRQVSTESTEQHPTWPTLLAPTMRPQPG